MELLTISEYVKLKYFSVPLRIFFDTFLSNFLKIKCDWSSEFCNLHLHLAWSELQLKQFENCPILEQLRLFPVESLPHHMMLWFRHSPPYWQITWALSYGRVPKTATVFILRGNKIFQCSKSHFFSDSIIAFISPAINKSIKNNAIYVFMFPCIQMFLYTVMYHIMTFLLTMVHIHDSDSVRLHIS